MNAKQTAFRFTQIGDKVVTLDKIVDLAQADESCIRQANDLELGQYIGKDERAGCERFLGLIADMDKIIKLGEALPLLVVLIRKCGGKSSCIENYGTLARECQISPSTIKRWGNKLEQMGFIQKGSDGPNGLIFTLNDEVIGKSDLFQKIDQKLSQSAEQIEATMVVANNAFKQALNSILFKTGKN